MGLDALEPATPAAINEWFDEVSTHDYNNQYNANDRQEFLKVFHDHLKKD